MYATFFTCVTLMCHSVFIHESSGPKIGVYYLECDMNNIIVKKNYDSELDILPYLQRFLYP